MRRDQLFSLIILLTIVSMVTVFLASIDTSQWSSAPSNTPGSSESVEEPGTITDGNVRYGVEKVIDGDTVIVSGLLDSIRLIGIDTAETNDRRPQIRCLADLATHRLKELVDGKEVLLARDVEDRDSYYRFLRYVYLPDGTMVNLTMLREGYAKILTIPPNMRFAPLFLAAQEEARRNNRGLWNAVTCAEAS